MTKIEWTNPPGYANGKTWNPTLGCSHVSDGCDNCYAATWANRGMKAHRGLTVKGQAGVLKGRPIFNGVIKLMEDRLMIPFKEKTARTWFVDSMSDLFHPKVPFEFVDRVMATIALCPRHRFIVLTKRPERMFDYFTEEERVGRAIFEIVADMTRDKEESKVSLYMYGDQLQASDYMDKNASSPPRHLENMTWRMPLKNLVLGVSVENQETANERMPILGHTPAAARCVSAEPLLGPIIFMDLCCGDIHWIISGGESGSHSRPSLPDWHRSIRDECAHDGVAYFFKQWGEWGPNSKEGVTSGRIRKHMIRVGKKAAGRTLDGREHSEYPQILMDRAGGNSHHQATKKSERSSRRTKRREHT